MTTTTNDSRDKLAELAHFTLAATDGNATKAAKAMDLPRTTFRALVARHEAKLAAQAAPAEAEAEALQAGIDKAVKAGEMTVFEPTAPAVKRFKPGVQYDLAGGQVVEHSPVAVTDLSAPVVNGYDALDEAAANGTTVDGTPVKVHTRKGKTAKAKDEDGADKAAVVFPEGVCSPISFRGLLIAEGLAPADLTIQTTYGWVRGKRNPLPVRWYDADGTSHAIKHPGTKPGVDIAKGRDWFKASPWFAKRQG